MYLCNKELFDRKTSQITEFETVAKSLPRSSRKADKWLISNIFLFTYRILYKNITIDRQQKDKTKSDLFPITSRLFLFSNRFVFP